MAPCHPLFPALGRAMDRPPDPAQYNSTGADRRWRERSDQFLVRAVLRRNPAQGSRRLRPPAAVVPLGRRERVHAWLRADRDPAGPARGTAILHAAAAADTLATMDDQCLPWRVSDGARLLHDRAYQKG